MSISFDTFEEHIFLNTVRIENLTDREVGTGFLFRKDYGEKETKILLFSNKHVFWGKKDALNPHAKKSLRITMHKKEEDGTYTLGTVHVFNFNDLDREKLRTLKGYVDHPDPDVDVACLNISGITEHIKPHLSVLTENYFDYDIDKLFCGHGIVFIGYPNGLYDTKHFLPILRAGVIASIPHVDFDGKPQILIDAQVFPGSSGSPVFTIVNGRYKFLGIVSSARAKLLDFMDTNAPAASVPGAPQQIPVEWLGLGVLFKSETVKKVFDLFPASATRGV